MSLTEVSKEIGSDTQGVNGNDPGLLEEMMPSLGQRERFVLANVTLAGVGGVLNCSGPWLNRSMQYIGAMLGCAVYYATANRIVAAVGGISVRWYSNFDAQTGEMGGKRPVQGCLFDH